MSWRTYPRLRPSGVTWIGDVPEHWKVEPVRRAARLASGHTPSRSVQEYWENCTVPWFTLADVWQIREEGRTYVVDTKEKISELGLANSSACLLPKGTVMLSRTASVGFAAIMGVPMATTQDFANWVCSPDLLPEYLLYSLRSMKSEFDRLMMGSTHNTIYMPDIAQLTFAKPPVDEQRTVVAFLDRETAKIDALVDEQKWLIELLKEKRQAVISHAVTKGLDPNAPMKDSGVEWIGSVPDHWRVCAINHRYEVELGKMLDEKRITGEYLAPYLRNVDVQWGRINTTDLPKMDFQDGDLDRYSLRPGDLLVCEGGEVGRAAVWGGELSQCFYQKALHRLRPRVSSTDLPTFALYLFYAAAKQGVFTGGEGRSTIAHLTAEALRRYRFPYGATIWMRTASIRMRSGGRVER